ncbi:unnamed protein product [Oppiella nova]|uniref:SHSP domain-containing protein n=1 Tax=Oppiella nova TaxID=334625 RepID=A0A7R9QSI4_9ACAR|nr:unnamed protein product [Oppiella nova]CAG2173395.1 unnamed protein product [Oppiella nova]
MFLMPSMDELWTQEMETMFGRKRALKRLNGHNCEDRRLSSQPKRGKSDVFSVKLNVKHFTANEIIVKVVGSDLIVTGKHDEREDKSAGGYVSRQFTRRYAIPVDTDVKAMASSLAFNGLLVISAPVKTSPQERVIAVKVVDKHSEDNDSAGSDETITTTITAVEDTGDGEREASTKQ